MTKKIGNLFGKKTKNHKAIRLGRGGEGSTFGSQEIPRNAACLKSEQCIENMSPPCNAPLHSNIDCECPDSRKSTSHIGHYDMAILKGRTKHNV